MAEGEVSRGKHSLEGPYKLICVLLKCSARPRWHSVGIPSVLLILLGRSINEIGFTVAILGVRADVRSAIARDYRIFTCVATVKHFDQTYVPVSQRAVMTVELKLVSLVVEVFLKPVAGMVAVLSLIMGYLLHNNSRWIWISLRFSDESFDILQQV